MRRRYVMGTFLSVQIMGEDSERHEWIFLEEIQRLENLLSIYRPESEISQINRAAGDQPVRVSPETCQIIAEALRFAHLSSGAFDPTVRPLGYRQVVLDSRKQTVFLAEPGMRLDLGGIGKGMALDRALARVLEEGTPESVSGDFGGQLLFWHPGGSFGSETITIEDPVSRTLDATFRIDSNCSVSTSSNAERPYHLLDPRHGNPVQKLASVTIAAPTGALAEALSTAVFVMGEKTGLSWLEKFPDVRAFVFRYESEN